MPFGKPAEMGSIVVFATGHILASEGAKTASSVQKMIAVGAFTKISWDDVANGLKERIANPEKID